MGKVEEERLRILICLNAKAKNLLLQRWDNSQIQRNNSQFARDNSQSR
ncbi:MULTISPECIES: hypothetical protein [unclassified Ureibacillus]